MDNLIDWFYGQVVGFLGNFFAEMGNMGVELFDLDWVQAIVLFFSQLGWALFGVSLVVEHSERVPVGMPVYHRPRAALLPVGDPAGDLCLRAHRLWDQYWNGGPTDH